MLAREGTAIGILIRILAIEMSKAKNNPKRQTEEYRTERAPEGLAAQPAEQEQEQQSKAPEPRRTPQQWESLVNQRIEEAMRNGAFDNLRNKGKPLDTAPDPHVPPDMQMANSLLKNNDLSPAWISDRGAMLAAIERFREKLRTVAADFAQAAKTITTQRRQQLDEIGKPTSTAGAPRW